MTKLISPSEKRKKKKALSTLSKLNSKANELWMPLLFKDLILQTKHLDCYFHAMTRNPQVGTFVHSLIFTHYFSNYGMGNARRTLDWIP